MAIRKYRPTSPGIRFRTDLGNEKGVLLGRGFKTEYRGENRSMVTANIDRVADGDKRGDSEEQHSGRGNGKRISKLERGDEIQDKEKQ